MSQYRIIYDLLHRQPFQAFRVYVKDGRTYDVHRAWNNVLGSNLFVIAIPDPRDPGPYPLAIESVHLPMQDIDRVEVLPNPITSFAG
jgi:hypothetical protein